MVETETTIEYTHVATCTVGGCTNTKLTTSEKAFIISADVKEKFGEGPTDHDCEMTPTELSDGPKEVTLTYEIEEDERQ